jgi:hypothetical protein
LFEHNLIDLINKGVECTKLFKSKVFSYTFDYDEWPATNANTSKILAPYNESIFKLRYEYKNTYPKIWKKDYDHHKLVEMGKVKSN